MHSRTRAKGRHRAAQVLHSNSDDDGAVTDDYSDDDVPLSKKKLPPKIDTSSDDYEEEEQDNDEEALAEALKAQSIGKESSEEGSDDGRGVGRRDQGSDFERLLEESPLFAHARRNIFDESEEDEDAPQEPTTRLQQLREAHKRNGGRTRIEDTIGRLDTGAHPLQRIGFYHSKSKEDLPIKYFDLAATFFREVFVDHTLGRERGENEEHIHSQARGSVYAPEGRQGLTALTSLFKSWCGIPTGEGHKIQFKFLDPIGQPDEKMIAYTMKDRGLAHFKFDSSDAEGNPLCEDYIEHCEALYKV